MSLVPNGLRFTKSHEWVRNNGDGTFSVGITDHAQELLGDIVFVELPEVGMQLNAGNECAVIESVKAASDIYSPLDGEVETVNKLLNDTPETINNSPYDDGWIFTIRAEVESAASLLSADEYRDIAEV